MERIRILLVMFIELMGPITLCCSHPTWAATLPGKSLEECFRAALARSETVAIQGELITQAEQNYRQAIGGVLPTIGGTAQEVWQDQPASGVGSGLFPAVQPLIKINLSQPLFRGFRELAGIRSSRDLVEVQSDLLQAASVQLFTDVAQSFYTVLTLEQDLRDLAEEIESYRKRIVELNQRRRIGRSRTSEILSTQSSMSALKAQVELEKGQLEAQREVLTFLTGFSEETPLEKQTSLPEPPARLDEELRRVELRPDVRAENKKVLSAEEGVRIAQGGHLPSLDLGGNYYFLRSGYASGVNWDVILALTLPIYSGGTISSQVLQAESVERQAELSRSLVMRSADREIRSLYALLRADLAQVAALKESESMAERNFIEQNKDYRLGLVTNLDVLQALTLFRESRRALDRAWHTAALDRAKLDAAVFRRPRLQ